MPEQVYTAPFPAESDFDIRGLVPRDDGGLVALVSRQVTNFDGQRDYNAEALYLDGAGAVEGVVTVRDRTDAYSGTDYGGDALIRLSGGTIIASDEYSSFNDERAGATFTLLPQTATEALGPSGDISMSVYVTPQFGTLSPLPNGNFAVSRFNEDDATQHIVHFPTGQSSGRSFETPIAPPDTFSTANSILLPHPVGGVVAIDAVYEGNLVDQRSYDLVVQRVTLTGTPLGDPVYLDGYRDLLDAQALPDGNFVLLVTSPVSGGPALVLLAPDGTLLGERSASLVFDGAPSEDQDLTVSQDGTIALAGVAGAAVTLQQFDSQLDPLTPVMQANETSSAGEPEVTGLGPDLTILWADNDAAALAVRQEAFATGDGIEGTAMADLLTGGAGRQVFFGLEGDDTMQGGAGPDAYHGGDGIDWVVYDQSTFVDLQMPGLNRDEAAGDTYAGVEGLLAGPQNGQLRGDGAGNILDGGGGWDRVYGRAGDDTLLGGTGGDALYGNLGADVMTGGTGAVRDRFIYFQPTDSGTGAGNRDLITDFVAGEDRIEISRLDADTTTPRNQRFDFVGDAAFSGTPGELRLEQAGGATIVQADRDGDGTADFEIELAGTLALTADDFLL